jgi:hypothetical protein
VFFFFQRHLVDHGFELCQVVGRILASHKIDEPETVFASNHEIFECAFHVVSKGNQAVTSNGQLALVKQVALFSAIVTYKIGGWLKHEMVERLVFKCVCWFVYNFFFELHFNIWSVYKCQFNGEITGLL